MLRGFEWSGYPEEFVKVFTKAETWHDAREICRSEGGDLVKVKHEINEWLAKQDMNLGSLWIGASDKVWDTKFSLP